MSTLGLFQDLHRKAMRYTTIGRGARLGGLHAALLTFQPLFLNAISIPATALIIRYLGEVGYGEWFTAATLVATTSFVSTLGLRPRFVRALAQDRGATQLLLAEQLGLRVALATFASLIAVVASSSLRYTAIVQLCVAFGCISTILAAVASAAIDLMQATERFAMISVANMAAGLVLTGCAVLTVVMGGGPVALSAAYVSGPTTLLLVVSVDLWRQGITICPHFRAERLKSLFWASRHVMVQQLFNVVSSSAASLMLPKLVGSAQFGVFSAGAILQDRLTILPDALATISFPQIAQSARHSASRARWRSLSMLLIAIAICITVALGITLCAPWIAQLLFRHGRDRCESVIRITIWALPAIAAEYIIGYSLLAAGREASQARASAAAVAANIVLAALMIPHMKLVGACWFIVLRPLVQIVFRLPDYCATFLWPVAESPGSSIVSSVAINDLCRSQ